MGQPYNPLIVQDLQPVKTYFVFSVHTMSSAATFPQRHTKKPACCGQSCSRKTKPHRQLHMRGLWDPHVILMKGSAQTGYRFLSASFEEYQNLLFLLRDLSGIEMKTCSLGIAVEIRGMCALFSRTRTHPRGEDVSESFQGLQKKTCTKWSNGAANSDLRVLSSCPNSEVWTRGKSLSFLCSHPGDGWRQSLLFLRHLSSRPKRNITVKNVVKASQQDIILKLASQNTQLLFRFWNSFLYCSFPLLSAIPSFFLATMSGKI